jgi:hypothetical protein
VQVPLLLSHTVQLKLVNAENPVECLGASGLAHS